MDIEHILNDCLNKAMCQKGRIQKPNSNNIADFVNNYLEAINYTRCCESDSELLKDKTGYNKVEDTDPNWVSYIDDMKT